MRTKVPLSLIANCRLPIANLVQSAIGNQALDRFRDSYPDLS
jgi:hypothetical protein